jgi:hypothetical protein
MALQNNDLLVVQQHNGGELRKASIGALLAKVPTGNTWKRTGTILSPVFNGDNVVIKNATGTTNNITLNANGSMTAAGTRYTLSANGNIDCQVNGPEIAKYTRDGDIGNVGIEYGDTSYGVRAGLGNTGVFGIAANGVNLVTSSAIELNADGSGQFTGDILIGGALPASPNISLNADGSIEAKSIDCGTY